MKYMINMISENGEDLQDDVFETYEEAEEYALYLCGCSRLGAEIMSMSNAEYEYDPETYIEPEYEIIGVED